jgi:enoyl-CoA hydratase/carnithine racemase
MPMIGHNIWIDKVLIASVNGHALGGGFALAQMADLVVASENATFGLPEVKWSRGAPWSVPLFGKIPERVWMELALTGDPIDAQRAYEIGLVNHVVPLEDLRTRTLELANKIANAAPLTVRASRRMIHLAAEMGRSAAWETANELFRTVFTSEDGQEGPRSFMEKRPAVWTGK